MKKHCLLAIASLVGVAAVGCSDSTGGGDGAGVDAPAFPTEDLGHDGAGGGADGADDGAGSADGIGPVGDGGGDGSGDASGGGDGGGGQDTALATGQCAAIGTACVPAEAQPSPYTCVEYGTAGAGICREACVGPQSGQGNPCAQGICGAIPGEAGYCLPRDCGGFFANDCGPDATCLPTGDRSNVCVPDGAGAFGAACGLHDECGHDLFCIGGRCRTPECTADTDLVPCPGDEECVALVAGTTPLAVGQCPESCTAFEAGECPADEWCRPAVNPPTAGPIDGACTPIVSGGIAKGQPCDEAGAVCDGGMLCVASAGDGQVCELACDPDVAMSGDPGGCPDGEGCMPLVDIDAEGLVAAILDFGSCTPSCTPWVADGSGCPGGTWCNPSPFNARIGHCDATVGPRGLGESCNEGSPSTSCAAGLTCFGDPGDGDTRCERLCEVAAVAGSLGDTCAASEHCEPIVLFSSTGSPLALETGACAE